MMRQLLEEVQLEVNIFSMRVIRQRELNYLMILTPSSLTRQFSSTTSEIETFSMICETEYKIFPFSQ